jgi:hypothetical protein
VTARAIKRVISRQLDALMEDQGLTKSQLAKRMKTSRAQLDRLLEPDNELGDARHPHARRSGRWPPAENGTGVAAMTMMTYIDPATGRVTKGRRVM